MNKRELKSLIKGLVEEALDKNNTQRFYRGLSKEYDPSLLNKTYATNDYTYWTDNPEVAEQYAGENGFVYYIDIPISLVSDDLIDEDPTSETYGDRNLMVSNGKPISINGITGEEYILYNMHEYFEDNPLELKKL